MSDGNSFVKNCLKNNHRKAQVLQFMTNFDEIRQLLRVTTILRAELDQLKIMKEMTLADLNAHDSHDINIKACDRLCV